MLYLLTIHKFGKYIDNITGASPVCNEQPTLLPGRETQSLKFQLQTITLIMYEDEMFLLTLIINYVGLLQSLAY